MAGELAGHLEEQYEALLLNGGEEQEAFVERQAIWQGIGKSCAGESFRRSRRNL